MTTIRLHNTKTRKKEVFAPLDPTNVRMYVCGPTVYDRAHLGNARPVLVFDVLFRLLRHVYGENSVTYARNFTDVDDKINDTARSRKEAGASGTLEELITERTNETIAWYHADMDALGALRPTMEPRATEWIGAMKDMIAGLIDRGHAYEKEGHVLFRVRSYADYGALSGRSVDDMIAGARVEVAPFKEDPMDFVLWKPSDDETPGWDSPWGRGRPGWHIECSAMSYELLGESFDIHGGGNDLQFPHHENEIAQSKCAHPHGDFARVWMHNEMLQVEGKKMSKSLGNFFTVRDLLDKGVPGEVIRFVMLSTHYSKPMDWTEKKRQDAELTLRRWRTILSGVTPTKIDSKWILTLGNDLNVPQIISDLRGMGQVLYQMAGNTWQFRAELLDNPEWSENAGLMLAMANLIGLLEPEMGKWCNEIDLSQLTLDLEALRDLASETKDFSAVDELKAALIAAGVEVRMSKTGVELMPGVGFDPAKLEALK